MPRPLGRGSRRRAERGVQSPDRAPEGRLRVHQRRRGEEF